MKKVFIQPTDKLLIFRIKFTKKIEYDVDLPFEVGDEEKLTSDEFAHFHACINYLARWYPSADLSFSPDRRYIEVRNLTIETMKKICSRRTDLKFEIIDTFPVDPAENFPE